MAKIAVNYEVPGIPNFIRVHGGAVPIEDLSDEELRDIGAAWTDGLIARAKSKRENSKNR